MRSHGLWLLIFLTHAFVGGLSAQAEEDMQTRVFDTPASFILGEKLYPPDPARPADPFAPVPSVEPQWRRFKTPREILEAQGISFPEGASATYHIPTRRLTVHNTQPNLDLVEAYVAISRNNGLRIVSHVLTVIEGPGEMLRQVNASAAQQTDSRQALDQLLLRAREPGSKVRVVADAFLDSRAQSRTSTSGGREHAHTSHVERDRTGRITPQSDQQTLGVVFEVAPVLHGQDVLIETDFSVKLHPLPPVPRQISLTEPITSSAAAFPVSDIPAVSFSGVTSSKSGDTRLIGLAKAVSTIPGNATKNDALAPKEATAAEEDRLLAAFLTTTLCSAETRPLLQPAEVPPPKNLPRGMAFGAYQVPDHLFAPAMAAMQQTLHPWLETAGVPKVEGSSTEHKNGVLSAINTPANLDLIGLLAETFLAECPKNLALTLHTVEAPAELLRQLTRQHAGAADHTAFWRALEAATARGETRFVDSAFLEITPGVRPRHAAIREHQHVSDYRTHDQGLPEPDFETRNVGSDFAITSSSLVVQGSVDVSIEHELHSRAPEMRRDFYLDPASKQRMDLPRTDFHVLRTQTQTVLHHGGVRLLSLQAPSTESGTQKEDVLWATFVHCQIVPQTAALAGAIHSQPPPPPSQGKGVRAMEMKTFRVPPDFLKRADVYRRALDVPRAPADPFAPAPSAVTIPAGRPTSRNSLEAAGITFPEGSSAAFNPATHTLIVRNTVENLHRIEIFVEEIENMTPPPIVVTTQVVQAPAPLLRKLAAAAAGKRDHRTELDELLAAVTAGTARHLSTLRTETIADRQAISRQGTDYQALSSLSIDGAGKPVLEYETRNVGLKVDFNASLEKLNRRIASSSVERNNSLVTLALTAEYHTAPPFEHREHLTDPQGRPLEFPLTDFHTAQLNTRLILPAGAARLVSLWKPTGRTEFEKEDVLQVMFITCDVLRVETAK